jgi:hypothetical protein
MVFALASAVAPSVVPRVPRPSVDRARRVDRAFRARRVPRRRASRVPRRRVRAVFAERHISVESKSHSRAALIDIRTPGCFSDRFKSPARRLGVSDVSDDAIARRTSRRARRATGDGRRRRRRIATRRDATPATTTRDDDDDDARRERR